MLTTETTTYKINPQPILWLSDSRGIYIPRDFATSFADRNRDVTGVSEDEWTCLENGPDHAETGEAYWDVWNDVVGNARLVDNYDSTIMRHGKAVEYFVWQDGDCWLVPVGMEFDEDGSHGETWYWPGDDIDIEDDEDEELDDDTE